MTPDALLSRAAGLILEARHLVVLTGAGVSTPSGIPDFRSLESGLWNKVNPWVVASLNAFRIRPQLFFDWIRPLVQTLLDALPNPAHQALATLEQMGKLSAIITQNIDNLHQKAGSKNVIEVHGHLRNATCVRCYHVVQIDTLLATIIRSRELPKCEKCGGVLKPNVILLGEQLPFQAINAARGHANQCDVMMVAGSSLQVSPVADLPYMAREHGAQLIVINQQPTPIDREAALVIREDVAIVLPLIVSLLAQKATTPSDRS